MNRPGAGPQTLRSIPGNVFQNQPQPGPRSGALGGARLQNGKLGSGSGWAFPAAMGNAPSPQSAQARPGQSNLTSFAQTIGGAQNQASLDLSEFPSLSGAPQAQQQNPSAIWGNNQNLRSNNAQRQQTQTPVHAPQSSQPAISQQQQRPEQRDGPSFPTLGNSGSTVDEMRFDDRPTESRPSRTPAQQGSGDDFPPLGGLGDGDPRQPSHQSRYNGAGNALYGQQQQQSSRGFGHPETRTDPLAAPGAGGSLASPSNNASASASTSRTLAEGNMDEQAAFPRRTGQDGFAFPHRGLPPGQLPPARSDPNEAAPAEGQISDYQQMSDLDRYGLNGLLAQMQSGNPDQIGLFVGMDLGTLGLDLSRPEPLWPDWPGPFASPRSHPTIPDFKLPAAYSVHNVPPLHDRISSFSDETLFAIFYGMPRDVSQELAANELYARDWRWHKKMQQWMMKAKEFGEPVQLPSNKEERGWYYFFDVHTWRRDRKEFILNYEHLYHGHTATPLTMP